MERGFRIDLRPYLGKINAKGIHIQAIQEAGKGLAEAGQALVHELEMHHVGLQVGHGVGQLGEGGLEHVERERALSAAVAGGAAGGVAEGGARGWSEGGGGTRSRGGALGGGLEGFGGHCLVLAGWVGGGRFVRVCEGERLLEIAQIGRGIGSGNVVWLLVVSGHCRGVASSAGDVNNGLYV